MKTRPRQLTRLSLFLLGLAVSMPVQIMSLQGNSPFELAAIAAGLAPLNWITMALALAAAWLSYRASPLLMVVAPVLVCAVLQNNFLVAEIGEDYPPLWVGAASFLFLLSMATLLHREVREIITSPERRWWLTPARRRARIPVRLGLGRGDVHALTFDLSDGGAFLPDVQELRVGSVYSMVLTLGRDRTIELAAEIVRTAPATGAYPAGVGLRFLHVGFSERRALRDYLTSVQAAA